MSADVERAARATERIRRFGRRRPEALALARYASLAVRVDSPLLRSLRLEFLPGTDAGVEAEVWFSPLTESVSSQGFVLDPHVADQLRRELAAELVGDEQRALDRAAWITATAHRDWPPSLQLEEEITRVALKRKSQPDELEALLRKMAKAMTEDTTRGVEIARWAQRALSRLPQAARETEAALLLALGAAERLGVNVPLPEADRARALPERTGWILPTPKFARETRIGLRRYTEGIEFLAPAEAPMTIELPLTTPLYLMVSWFEGTNTPSTRTVSVAPGRKVAIPQQAVDIRLRTLAGRELALESVTSETATGAANTTVSVDLRRACVLVRVYLGSSPENPYECAGFFVASDAIATRVADDRVNAGDRCQILWSNQRIGATLASIDNQTGDTLLRLDHGKVQNAIVLPLQSDASAVAADEVWQSVAFDGENALVVEGTVRTVGEDGFVQLGAGPALADRLRSGRIVLTGAPVIVSGRIVAQIVRIDAGPEDSSVLARIVGPSIVQEGADSAPASEAAPSVILGVPWRDAGSAATERIRRALASARIRPIMIVTEDALERSRAVNDSVGAALLVTTAAGEKPRVPPEGLSLAYRRWVKADFPIAIFRSADADARTDADKPIPVPALRRLPVCDLDRESDESAGKFALSNFAVLQARTDEGAGLERVTQRVQVLLERALLPAPSPGAVRSILADGVHAQLDWKLALLNLPSEDGEELIHVAAMFSFPIQTYRPLLDLARGVTDVRAFVTNATSVNVAQALIHRAWIGEASPHWIVFADQNREAPSNPQQVLVSVAEAIAKDLECDVGEAQRLVTEVRGPLVLVFTTRPVPEVSYIETLQKTLPQCVLFFLGGSTVRRSWPPSIGFVELIAAREKEKDLRFLRQYERLMELVSRRDAPKDTIAQRASAAGRPNPPRKKAKTKQSVKRRPGKKKSSTKK